MSKIIRVNENSNVRLISSRFCVGSFRVEKGRAYGQYQMRSYPWIIYLLGKSWEKGFIFTFKYTNPANQHSWLLQAKVDRPSFGDAPPLSQQNGEMAEHEHKLTVINMSHAESEWLNLNLNRKENKKQTTKPEKTLKSPTPL